MGSILAFDIEPGGSKDRLASALASSPGFLQSLPSFYKQVLEYCQSHLDNVRILPLIPSYVSFIILLVLHCSRLLFGRDPLPD